MGLPDYAELLGLARRDERVHLDTAMAFTAWSERTVPFPAPLTDSPVDLGDRIVLGSSFPNIPHPYAGQIAGLVRSCVGVGWLPGDLHDNAAARLGLSSYAHRMAASDDPK